MSRAILLLTLIGLPSLANEPILLRPGFVTKVHCDGRLLVSAVGNEALVQLQALPKELGCGVLLKPLATLGESNLILETSAGTVTALVEVKAGQSPPRPGELNVELKGDGR